MSTRTEMVSVELRYLDGFDEPEKGIYRSAVGEPEHVDELLVWVEDHATVDSGEERGELGPRYQVNLCGTRRALFELGCYFVALSRFDTKDSGYHDHFDEFAAPDGKPACELLIHSPVRLSNEQ